MARDSDASQERRQKESQTAANERHRDTTEATRKFREDSMTADERHKEQQRVDEARENLQNNLLALEKEQAKELEAQGFNPEAQRTIMQRYGGLKDDAILGTVSWLSSQNLPGYDVSDEQGLKSLLVQNGMDMGGAGQHAKTVWAQIAPRQPSASESVGVDQNTVARGQRASSEVDFLTDPSLISAIDESRPGATSSANPTQGAPGLPSNELFSEPQAPAPGSLKNIFNSTPIQNPDGTPQFPKNPDALGPKLMDWLNKPSDQLFQ
jgi:hypothetical protein